MGNDNSKVKLLINLFVLGLSLHGISNSDFKGHKTSFFERMIISIVAPFQKGSISIQKGISESLDNYVFIVNAKKENKKLRKKISILEGMLFKSRELESENQRLKDLLKFGAEIQKEKVLAQIIGRNANSGQKTLRINKGINDGIKLYSTVVTAEGLVGFVTRITGGYADILTILDQNNRVDAIVTRTRSHGIIEGYSDTKCIMKYVTRTEPVVLNDEVITAGLGEIYPKGLKIGIVSKIERESYGITQMIEVTPSVDFGKLEEVIVLVNSMTNESAETNTEQSVETQ